MMNDKETTEVSRRRKIFFFLSCYDIHHSDLFFRLLPEVGNESFSIEKKERKYDVVYSFLSTTCRRRLYESASLLY